MNAMNLVMGDWSNDGHGKTHTITIKTDFSKKEIESAYKVGTKIIGFDLINDVGAAYEDRTLSKDHYDKLVELNFPHIEDIDSYEDEHSLWMGSFSEIYLFIVKLGNPEFEYEVVKNQDLHIGGYGLFV